MEKTKITRKQESTQNIIPNFWFDNQAEEAINFYTSTFDNSEIMGILYYNENDLDVENTVKHAHFSLNGEGFMAMDSSMDHQFSFTEAISLIVSCEDQQEIDRYWETLSEDGDPNAQQCGWLKDKFDVSWQVIPRMLEEMITDEDQERSDRVMKTLLPMKKLDISRLQKAYAQHNRI